MKKRFNLDLVEPRKRILKFWTFARNGQFTETGEGGTKPEVLEKPLIVGVFEPSKGVIWCFTGRRTRLCTESLGSIKQFGRKWPLGHFRLIDLEFSQHNQIQRPLKCPSTCFNYSNRSILRGFLVTSGLTGSEQKIT